MCILIPSPIFRWLLGVVDECRIDPFNVEISLPKLVKMAVIWLWIHKFTNILTTWYKKDVVQSVGYEICFLIRCRDSHETHQNGCDMSR